MKDKHREERARLRAEAYAPAPTDSRLLYGAIAVVLLLMAVAAAGAFYAVDLWREPFIIGALAALAFGAGLLVRRHRMRRHRVAHRTEYDSANGDSGEPRRDTGMHAERGAR